MKHLLAVMNKISTDGFRDHALLMIRICIGAIFVAHGYSKLLDGPDKWLWLGSQMENLGISFFPVAWGFMAAISELLGGALLASGLFHRLGTLLLSSTMFVAVIFHITRGDSFMASSHAIELLVLFVSLFFIGPGKFSLDRRILTTHCIS